MIGSSSLANLGGTNWLPSDAPSLSFDDGVKIAPVLSSPPIVYGNIKKSTKLLKPLKRDELLTTQFKEISLLSQFDLLESIPFDNQTLKGHNKRKNKTSPSKYSKNNYSISSPSKYKINTSSSMTFIFASQYENDISCYDDFDDQPETPLNQTSSAANLPTKKHANTWTNTSSSSQHAKIASPSSFRAQSALPPFGHDFYPQHPTHRPPPLVPPVLPRSLPLVHSALSFDDSSSMMTEQYNNTLHTTNNNDNNNNDNNDYNTTYTTTSIHDVPDLSLPNSPSYTHPYPIIDTGTVSKPFSKREKYANYTLYNNNTNTYNTTNTAINSIIITQLVSAENHVTNLHNNYHTREAQYKQKYKYEQQLMSCRMSQRALAREQHLHEIYTKTQQYKLFINNKVNVINENRRKSTIHILHHIQTLLEEDKKLEESQNYDRILHTRERDRQLTDDFQNKYDPEVVRIQKMEVRIMTFLNICVTYYCHIILVYVYVLYNNMMHMYYVLV